MSCFQPFYFVAAVCLYPAVPIHTPLPYPHSELRAPGWQHPCQVSAIPAGCGPMPHVVTLLPSPLFADPSSRTSS